MNPLVNQASGSKMQYLVTGLVVSLFFITDAADGKESLDTLCGPRCLAFIYRDIGVPYLPDQMIVNTDYKPAFGTNMKNLLFDAKSRGLHTAGVRGLLPDLVAQIRPGVYGILALDNHFVVLIDRGEGVLLVDVSRGRIQILSGLVTTVDDAELPMLLLTRDELMLALPSSTMYGRLSPYFWGLVSLLIAGAVYWSLRFSRRIRLPPRRASHRGV